MSIQWICDHGEKLESKPRNEETCLICRAQISAFHSESIRSCATMRLLLGMRLQLEDFDSQKLCSMPTSRILAIWNHFSYQTRAMRSLVIPAAPIAPKHIPSNVKANKASSVTHSDSTHAHGRGKDDSEPLLHEPQQPSGSNYNPIGLECIEKHETIGNDVKSWYLRQLSCSILETLTEAIYRRVWDGNNAIDSVAASRMPFGSFRLSEKTCEEEIRWKKIEALLVSFERGRAIKMRDIAKDIAQCYRNEDYSIRNDDEMDDTVVSIESWDVLRYALYSSRPPSLKDLQRAILRSNDESKTFSMLSVPDLNEIGEDLFELSVCEAPSQFLNYASRAMFIFSRVVQEVVALSPISFQK